MGAKTSYEKLNDILFPCGKKKLGEVTSVATESKTGTVKYNPTITIDTAELDKLSACTIDRPKAGEHNETMEFIKDDDGNWAPK